MSAIAHPPFYNARMRPKLFLRAARGRAARKNDLAAAIKNANKHPFVFTGFPLFVYQSKALASLPPIANSPGVDVAHLPADTPIAELYAYVSGGVPFVVGKGLLDGWPANERCAPFTFPPPAVQS